jgi:hypothetical protein
MCKILTFEWILLLKIQTNCKKIVAKHSNKLQKLGSEGKISRALDVFTLGPTPQATLM